MKKLNNRYARAIVWLFFCLIVALLFSSCSTVKKHRSTTKTTVDSTSLNISSTVKEKTTVKKWNDTVTVKVSDVIDHPFDGTDTCTKTIETEDYTLSIKGGKKGNVKVEGKIKKVPVPVMEAVFEKETTNDVAAKKTQIKTTTTAKDKEKTGLPMSLYIGFAIAIAAIIFFVIRKKILLRS